MLTSKISLNWKNALILSVLFSLFWCLIVFLAYTGAISSKIEMKIALTDMFSETGRQFLLNAVLFFALFYFQFSVFNKNCHKKRKVWTLTAGSILIVFIFVALLMVVSDFTNTTHKEFPNVFFFLVYTIIISAMTNLISSLFYITGEREKTIVENQKLLVENMQASYETLKSQINPHYLFNVLNTIHALVDINSEEAKDAIIKLSYLMRYLLYECEAENVLLKREINFIEGYIELMRLRYDEDDMTIETDYPSDIDTVRVPPFCFLPFLENAFKHGVHPIERSFMKISFSVENDLTFSIINSHWDDAPTLPQNNASGIGLENVRKRLDLIYHDNYALDIQHIGNEYTVTLKIPVT